MKKIAFGLAAVLVTATAAFAQSEAPKTSQTTPAVSSSGEYGLEGWKARQRRTRFPGQHHDVAVSVISHKDNKISKRGNHHENDHWSLRLL